MPILSSRLDRSSRAEPAGNPYAENEYKPETTRRTSASPRPETRSAAEVKRADPLVYGGLPCATPAAARDVAALFDAMAFLEATRGKGEVLAFITCSAKAGLDGDRVDLLRIVTREVSNKLGAEAVGLVVREQAGTGLHGHYVVRVRRDRLQTLKAIGRQPRVARWDSPEEDRYRALDVGIVDDWRGLATYLSKELRDGKPLRVGWSRLSLNKRLAAEMHAIGLYEPRAEKRPRRGLPHAGANKGGQSSSGPHTSSTTQAKVRLGATEVRQPDKRAGQEPSPDVRDVGWPAATIQKCNVKYLNVSCKVWQSYPARIARARKESTPSATRPRGRDPPMSADRRPPASLTQALDEGLIYLGALAISLVRMPSACMRFVGCFVRLHVFETCAANRAPSKSLNVMQMLTKKRLRAP